MVDPVAVNVEDLVVEFRSGGYAVRPIDGLSLQVAPGTLTLLLGPSGCGKTTLLSCLAGMLAPTSGTIQVHGVDVASLRGASLTDYRRHGVGIVFQAFNLIGSLSAQENVMVPLGTDRATRGGAAVSAAEILGRVGLADRIHHRPGELSGGQQQRVAIARAIALDPPLVLADEPTAHLDYIQVEGVLRLLRGLADDGRAVIVSTHDERMLPLADQVVEMQPRTMASVELIDEITVAAGEVIFEQGALPDLIYVIESGRVEILGGAGGDAPDRLALLGAGDHFGEMGPLFGLRRSATARAESETVLRAMSPRSFREWLGDDARLAAVISGTDRTEPRGAGPAA